MTSATILFVGDEVSAKQAQMLARQEKARECDLSASDAGPPVDRQSDPDSVGSRAWWAALKDDIARCRETGAGHTRRICNVLDGLHGHSWQNWVERQLEKESPSPPPPPKLASASAKLRCITCGHSFAFAIVRQHAWVKCPECGFKTPCHKRYAK